MLIKNMIGFSRDIIKSVYLIIIQIITRLFYIKRFSGSAISFSSRLDVIPRKSAHALHKLEIGENTLLEERSALCTWQGDIKIGKGSNVGIGSYLIGPIEIGRDCRIAQNCLITGANHRSDNMDTFDIKKVFIGDNVWVGAHSVVLPGITIGSNVVVGAGSVVVEDILSRSVVVGNPAKIKRIIED